MTDWFLRFRLSSRSRRACQIRIRASDITMESLAAELPDAQHVARQIDRWRTEHAEFAFLIDGHGNPLSALRQFGSLCRNKCHYDLAIEALLAALAMAPTDAVPWRELASVYQITGRDELAEACVLRSLSIDPGHAITWLQYASLAYKLRRIDQSEAAYLRALSLDPNLGDANLGLGVLYLGSRKFEEAITYLRRSLSWGGADAVTHLCLGQSLYMAGRFGESADAFEAAATFATLEGITLRLHARARTFTSIRDGDIEGAIARYPALAGQEAESIDDVLRAAFSLFSAYGMHDAAVAVGRFRLTSEPDDPVQRYLLDAVAGRSHDRAPAAYLEMHFDEFAEGFDSKLVEVLGYRVPQDLTDLVSSSRSSFSAMLDLGCGTGLAAEPLRRFGAQLTGIDLSEKMLAAAQRRGAYSALVKADVIDFLAAKPDSFDLIFAADLLIYLGTLNVLIDGAAQSLMPGGYFAASIERADTDDFTLLPSGRFAHSEAYFESSVSRHFEVVRKRESGLRIEAGHPVPGILYVMRRHQS
jgi:predicted TPR repeat methyltransferase